MDNSISNYNPIAIEQQQVGKSAGELFYNKDILTTICVYIRVGRTKYFGYTFLKLILTMFYACLGKNLHIYFNCLELYYLTAYKVEPYKSIYLKSVTTKIKFPNLEPEI